MMDFAVETKIRELITELTIPTYKRTSECIEDIQNIQKNLEHHHHKMNSQIQQLSNLEAKIKMKFLDHDQLNEKVYSMEKAQLEREQEILQQITNLKIDNQSSEYALQRINEQFEQFNYQSQKLSEDIAVGINKINSVKSNIEQRVEAFSKEQYSSYMDLRNRVSKINEDNIFLTQNSQSHAKIFDNLIVELESFKAQRDWWKNKLTNIEQEVEGKVKLAQFLEKFDHLENLRNEDRQQFLQKTASMEHHLNLLLPLDTKLQEEINRRQAEIDLVRYDVKYFQSIMQDMQEEQKEMNDKTNQNIIALQESFEKNEQIWKMTFSEFSQTLLNHNQLINEIKAQNRKELIKLKQGFEEYKEQKTSELEVSFKESIEQFDKSLKKNFQVFIAEQTQDLIGKSIKELEEQWKLEGQKKEVRDVELQVIFEEVRSPGKRRVESQVVRESVDYEKIQEMMEKTFFELFNDVMSSSDVVRQQIGERVAEESEKLRKGVQQQMSEWSQKVQRVQVNNQKVQNSVELKQQEEESYVEQETRQGAQKVSEVVRTTDHSQELNELRAKVESLEADIVAMSELRNELAQNEESLKEEFRKLEEKTGQFKTQLIKFKSDSQNDQQYIHSQLKGLTRSKEMVNSKFSQLDSQHNNLKQLAYSMLTVLLQNELQGESEEYKVYNVSDGFSYTYSPQQKKIILRNATPVSKSEYLKSSIQQFVSVQFNSDMESQFQTQRTHTENDSVRCTQTSNGKYNLTPQRRNQKEINSFTVNRFLNRQHLNDKSFTYSSQFPNIKKRV